MKRWFFNKALRILLITNGLILISGAMFGPISALFVEKIGGNLMDASFAGFTFAIAAGLMTLISGKYADKFKNPENMVAIGYLAMSIGFFLYNFVSNIWFLFIVQFLIGSAEAFYSPAFDSLYSKHLTKNKAGREWGTWESTNYFSIAIGAAIGGIIASNFGFNAIFILMGTISCLSALYILFLPKEIL